MDNEELEESQLEASLRDIDESKTLINSAGRDAIAVNLSTIKSTFSDMNEAEAFSQIRNSPSTNEDTGRRVLQEAVDRSNEDLVEAGMNTFDTANSPAEIESTINATRQELDKNIALLSDPLGPEKMEAMVHSSPDTNIEDQQEYAFRAAAYKELSQVMGDMGVMDWAQDIGAIILPGNYIWNIKQVTGESLAEALPFTGKNHNSREVLRQAIRSFQEMPADRKEVIWPQLKEDILSKMNRIEGVDLLMKFLNPTSEEELWQYNDWVKGLDAVDAGLTAVGLSATLANLSRRYNKIARMSDLGDRTEAAKINTIALSDDTGDTASLLQIDRAAAADNASPVRHMDEMDAGVRDISPESMDRITNIVNNLKHSVRNIFEGDRAPMTISPLSETEEISLVASKEKSFLEDLKKRNFEVAGVSTEPVDNINYRMTGYVYKSGGIDGKPHVMPITRDWSVSLNDIGSYRGNMSNRTYLASPRHLWKKDVVAREDVMKAGRLDNISADQAFELGLQYKRINDLLTGRGSLRKKKRERVGEILIKGDEWTDASGAEGGRVFTPEELKYDYKLSNDEIEYYYGYRQFADEIGRLKNISSRKARILLGQKEVKLNVLGDEYNAFAKPYAEAHLAKAGIGPNETKVFDTRAGVTRTIRESTIDDIYEKGGRIVRLDETHNFNGNMHRLAVVDEGNIGELPFWVINRKPGYVPRAYPRGVYALQFRKAGVVDGHHVPMAYKKTLRLYDNEKELKQDLPIIKQKLRKAGELGPGDRVIEITPDKVDEIDLLGEPVGAGGGLYTGRRGEAPVPFGSDSERAMRTDPVESIEKMMTHIATMYPRNEWRLAHEQRLKNYAEVNNVPNFDVMRPVQDTSQAGKFLERMRTQYVDWNYFNTAEERWWSRKWRQFYEWSVPSKISRESPGAEAVFNVRHKDPVTAVRSFTFHSLLGYFNPAQVFVQAQAANVAFSLHPTAAPKILRSQMGLSAAIETGHTKYLAGKIKDLWGVDQENAEAIIELYRKTGLDRGVRTVGDLTASERGVETGLSGLARLGDKSLGPYRMGEKFNRRYSFLTALHRWQKKTGRKDFKNITDAELGKIYDESRLFMLDMGRALRAPWQKGVMSVPTQFMQVQAKFIETLINSELSVADRMKIMLGQFLLYGSAGVPVAGNKLADFVGVTTGLSQEELASNEAFRDFINGGFTQAFFHNMLNVEGEFATRGAILNGLDTLISDIFLGEAAPYELFAGASSVWPERIMGDSRQFWDFVATATGSGQIESKEVLWSAVQNLIEVTSTGDNLMKAYMIVKQGHLSSKYEPFIDEATPGDVIAQALGFTPSDIAEFYSTNKMIRAKQRAQQRVKDSITGLISDQITNPMRDQEEIDATVAYFLDSVTDNEQEKRKLVKELYESWNNPKNAKEEAIQKFLESQKSDIASAWYDKLGTKTMTQVEIEE